MKRIRTFFIAALCISTTIVLKAQNTSVIGGITADVIYRSTIEKIDHTILSEPNFLQNSYERSTVPVNGFSYGGFVNVMFESGLSINLDIAYAQEHGRMNFKNTANDWYYKMDFNYKYLNIFPSCRYYPWGNYQTCTQSQTPQDLKRGFYGLLGMQFGIPLNPESITYRSGGPGYLTAFGSDQEQENQLNTVLKGKTNIGVVIGAGFEFYNPIPFDIHIKCHRGISDVVETLPNSYNFVSDKNPNNFWQVGIGIFIGRSNRWTNKAYNLYR